MASRRRKKSTTQMRLGMTFEEYAKIDAVNFSTLKEARKSLRHYRYRLQNPLDDTTRLAIGRATHTAVFEPDRFLIDYALFTGPRRAGKDWKEFKYANRGRTILKQEEYETCLAIRDAVRSHPVAGPALAPPGEAEKVVVWDDKTTGIKCKARLDWYRPGLLCDLKTTTDVNARRFGHLAERMGYHCQMAWYHDGLEAVGLDAPLPRIIAVEVTEPHDVAVFAMTEDSLWAGQKINAELLSAVAAGAKAGAWPGRYPDEEELDLPNWAFGDPEDDGDLGVHFGSKGDVTDALESDVQG